VFHGFLVDYGPQYAGLFDILVVVFIVLYVAEMAFKIIALNMCCSGVRVAKASYELIFILSRSTSVLVAGKAATQPTVKQAHQAQEKTVTRLSKPKA
jgi:hypothetical protein